MKTFTKILLLVFWLLGAGTGGPSPDATLSRDAPAAYRIALFDGVDLQVHRDRVTVDVAAPWRDGSVAIAASVPGWVAAWSMQVHASSTALPAEATASDAAAPSPSAPSPSAPRGS